MNNFLNLFLTSIIIATCSSQTEDEVPLTLKDSISKLSSDEFEGRAPGTEGGKLTKNFIS